MTSYNTVDNYTEGSISGRVIKVISKTAFVLKTDDGYIYWCIIHNKDIHPPELGEEQSYFGLIENYYPNNKRYPIEMLIKKAA